MKFTLAQLINPAAVKSIEALAESPAVPVSSIWSIAKLLAKVKKENDTFQEVRRQIFMRYGEVNNDQINVPPQNLEKLNADLMEVLKQEIEIDFNPVPLPVNLPANSKLTAAELAVLLSMNLVTEGN